jgi:hypothetical protein
MSKFQGLFEPQANQPDQPVGDQVMKSDTTEEIKTSRNQEKSFPRIKTNYEIRQDYVQALKRVAVDESRKIYEVLDEAIAEYLERYQESKK